MIDTIGVELYSSQVGGVDLVVHLQSRLENVSFCRGGVCGYIGNLKIYTTSEKMSMKRGSLARFYYGNNLTTLNRDDFIRAIEELSLRLDLPLENGIICRLDLTRDIYTKHKPQQYLRYMGNIRYFKRLEQTSGLYYNDSVNARIIKRQYLFYDKLKEMKACERPKDGRNYLRFEVRYLRQLKLFFGGKIYVSTLYGVEFFNTLIDKWQDAYFSIDKQNEFEIDFENMSDKSVPAFKDLGVAELIRQSGGALQLCDQIRSAQKRGELIKYQADRLITNVKAISKKESVTRKSPLIDELDSLMANLR